MPPPNSREKEGAKRARKGLRRETQRDLMAANRDPWAFQRWAYRTTTGNPIRKSVLMVLAIMAEKNTGRCEGSQQSIAEWVETDVRTVRRHLEALKQLGVLARRHQYRHDGKRGCDEFLLLAPWVASWPDGQPLPGAVPASNGGVLPGADASTTGHQCPDIEKNQPLKTTASPRNTPNGVLLGARAAATTVELAVLAGVAQVAAAKQCPCPPHDRVLRLCDRFSDRDLTVDIEEFAHYWLDGKGENGPIRDVARTLGNWLKRAPSAEARQRSGRGRRQRVSTDESTRRTSALREVLREAGVRWAA